LRSKNKSNIFSDYAYLRTEACCGYLASNQELLIHILHDTHQKSNRQTLFLYSEKQYN